MTSTCRFWILGYFFLHSFLRFDRGAITRKRWYFACSQVLVLSKKWWTEESRGEQVIGWRTPRHQYSKFNISKYTTRLSYHIILIYTRDHSQNHTYHIRHQRIMNTVSYEVRGFAHPAFLAATNVLIFQNLSHVREPNQRDRGLTSQTKTLDRFCWCPIWGSWWRSLLGTNILLGSW